MFVVGSLGLLLVGKVRGFSCDYLSWVFFLWIEKGVCKILFGCVGEFV